MRISVWSSDVCSSDLLQLALAKLQFLGRTSLVGDIVHHQTEAAQAAVIVEQRGQRDIGNEDAAILAAAHVARPETARRARRRKHALRLAGARSEEHTSELQSLMRISYAVFCLKKK